MRFLVSLVLVTAHGGSLLESASPPAVRGSRGMVVTPDATASRVGLEVLQSGGNAVDASVAVAFALAVTYPIAGNLGGGGFLLYRPPEGAPVALDFRETAPRKLRAAMFLDDAGRPIPDRSLSGGLAVGVPGSVAGLAEAHRLWGSRPWPELLAPAIRLADEGFPVSRGLASAFRQRAERILADPEGRRVFTREGAPYEEGQRLVQPDLARSLRRIAQHGADGFYRGPTAAAVAQSVSHHGGVLDRKDLAGYRAVVRRPLEGRYRGYRVIGFPGPSSGGLLLLQILGMLERFDLAESGPLASRTVHLMAEAERRAYADRSRWLGDPDFFRVPTAGLLDPDYVSRRAASIDPARATPSTGILPGKPNVAETEDTLHFSVADERGGAVALTTTLNTSFGSGIVATGTGILLNNEIDDFALAPGSPNVYGLLGEEANSVAGEKRPLSSMCPTIVELPERGRRPALVLGSPGGSKIITSVLQVLINVVDHDMPLQEAVDAPRFHHQWQPDRILHEVRTFPADVERALVALGHELETRSAPIGNVNAIGVDGEGRWLGAADPRQTGSALGY